jgi:hypothetical protein
MRCAREFVVLFATHPVEPSPPFFGRERSEELGAEEVPGGVLAEVGIDSRVPHPVGCAVEKREDVTRDVAINPEGCALEFRVIRCGGKHGPPEVAVLGIVKIAGRSDVIIAPFV